MLAGRTPSAAGSAYRKAELPKLWGKSRETVNRGLRNLVAWGYLDQLSQQARAQSLVRIPRRHQSHV